MGAPKLTPERAEEFNQIFRACGLPETSDEFESHFLLRVATAVSAALEPVRAAYVELGAAALSEEDPHKAMLKMARALPQVQREYEAAVKELLLVVCDAALEMYRR